MTHPAVSPTVQYQDCSPDSAFLCDAPWVCGPHPAHQGASLRQEPSPCASQHRAGHLGSVQPPSRKGRIEHLGLLAVGLLFFATCPQIYPALLTYPVGQDAHPFPPEQPFSWSGCIYPGLLPRTWLLGFVSLLHPGSPSFLPSRSRPEHNGSGVV